MSRLLKSSGALAAATLISRMLGFLRETVYAGFMGRGPVADAFYLALTAPNLFRRLLGEGALTAAFVPIFKEKERHAKDPAEVWDALNAVLCSIGLVCIALTVVVLAGLTLTLNFAPLGARWELVARLLRWMFPYVGLVCTAAVFIGVLNARSNFFLPALGASVINLVMIGSVYLLAPRFGDDLEHQVFGLALGLLIAGFAQAAIQLPSLRREGFRFRWVTPWTDPTVRLVLRRMAPATIGVAAYQINVVLTQTMAFGQGRSIVSAFNYAVRLLELPQGVVGISLATYLLTELSGIAAAKNYPAFRSTLKEGLLQLVFINALASALLLALAEPMIRLLFEHGRFHADDTPPTALALRCLAPGLLAFSLNNIMARAFYALGDTRTPMRISVMCLAANLLFACILIPVWRQAGMGVANTLSAAINAGLLFYAFKRAMPKFSLRELVPNFAKVVAAATAAGAVASYVFALCDAHAGRTGLGSRLLAVFAPMTAASSLFLGIAWSLRLPQVRELKALIFGDPTTAALATPNHGDA
jgi:putative peptidoglycan lipid II flippase